MELYALMEASFAAPGADVEIVGIFSSDQSAKDCAEKLRIKTRSWIEKFEMDVVNPAWTKLS